MKKGLNLLIIIGLILFISFALFPSKIDYTDQAKVLQGLSLAASYKEAVGEFWKDKGELPNGDDWNRNGNKVAVDLGKSLVESIHVGQDGPGTISVYYTNAKDQAAPADITGKKIVLTPEVQDNQLVWSCKGTIPAQYLPARCR
jgi:type IV pilus assembly protein PilA